MSNQPQTSPLISTKVLTLGSFGANKCLGSSEISMASEEFICFLRRLNHWSQPVIHVVSIKTKALVASVPLDLKEDSISERTAQCRINATGRWIVIYDCSSIWFLDVQSNTNPTNLRLVTQTSPAKIRLVKWTSSTTVTALLDNDFACEYSVTETLPRNTLPRKRLPPVAGNIVDFNVLGDWSVISTIAFEQSKAVGRLHLTDHELFFKAFDGVLEGFCGAFINVSRSLSPREFQLIYAVVGPDQYSLKVSAVRFGPLEAHTTLQWTKTVRYVRTPDLSTSDLPISLYISPDPGLIFIITSLSYVHVLLLADGAYLGCVRASTVPISGSVLCEDKWSVLLTDANCAVFKVSLNMLAWLQHLKRAEAGILTRVEPLRFILRQDEPLTAQLLAGLLMISIHDLQATQGRAFGRAVELLSNLTPDELVKFFNNTLQTHSTSPQAVAGIRRLAKHFSDEVPLSKLTEAFLAHCGDAGVFYFLNMLGPSNLFGLDLADYIQAAINAGQFGALWHSCLVAKPNDYAAVMEWLSMNDEEPQVAEILVKFCLRFNLFEDLAGHYINRDGTQTESILPWLDKCDTPQKFRVWTALLSHNVMDQVLDRLLAAQKVTFFTAETLTLFREHNRTRSWLAAAETWTTDLAADDDLFFLLIDAYKADQIRLAAFCRKLGSPRCEEIGRILRDKHHTGLAILVFKLGRCDYDYLALAFGNKLSLDAAVYCLSRTSKKLWLEVLGEVVLYRDQLLRVLATAEFRDDLLRHPFAAVCICVIALLEDGLLELAQSILEFLMMAVEFPDKRFRSFLQKSMITILAALNPTDSTKAVQFITMHHDFEHLKVLTDLLTQKSFVPAKAVITWLTKNRPNKEVKEEDLTRLTSAVVASGERTAWTVIGHCQLQRGNIEAAMQAYLKVPHYDNHVEVWNAVKTAQDHWALAATYLDMVGRYVADPRVHSALTIVLAKTGRFDDLERHLSRPSAAAVVEDVRTPSCRCCEDAPQEMNFLPCNHICACSGCAANLKECPICRAVIVSKHRVYLS